MDERDRVNGIIEITDHDYCIVDEICNLMNRGFTCYPAHEIVIGPTKTKRKYTAIVDIYAIKQKKEVIIEVGALSKSHGDRILLLRKLKPKAKIIHVQQWKNYGVNNYLMHLAYFEHNYIDKHLTTINRSDEEGY